jgi:hypothetical protein
MTKDLGAIPMPDLPSRPVGPALMSCDPLGWSTVPRLAAAGRRPS